MYVGISARQQHYDVVLVDTAGRMQDNEPLMKSLAKVLSAVSVAVYTFPFFSAHSSEPA